MSATDLGKTAPNFDRRRRAIEILESEVEGTKDRIRALSAGTRTDEDELDLIDLRFRLSVLQRELDHLQGAR